MTATIAIIVCLAYLLGLLLTGISATVAGVSLGAIVMLILGLTVAFLIRRIWRLAPRTWVWLVASLVGVAAIAYFQLRLPQPGATDICHLVGTATSEVSSANQTAKRSGNHSHNQWLNRSATCQPSLAKAEAKKFQVTGKVLTPPRLTRSNRLQFELASTQVNGFTREANLTGKANLTSKAKPVFQQATSGKVYVTVPPAAGEQLYPGLIVQIEGSLYKPKPATTPGSFDFEKYLAQQGIFTGLNGSRLEYPEGSKPAPPWFWTVRQKIVQTQAFGLGQPEAALVSAMVMGKNAVDVPYEIQDQFKQIGLAHALAASGMQVSLLIGVILKLTQRFGNKLRLGLGTGILFLYIGLTGMEPSVLRAGIMGFLVLLALTTDRRIKPLGALLAAATFLLLVNPLWIADLGFQLSFLATLGLLVTAPVLTKWLDWMPTTISPMFAVPIAAYLWTLPLQLGVFGVVSIYSIFVNILVSPLITVVSIGGMISAVGALIYPTVGSLLAGLLYYPAYLLIKGAEIGSQLPGNVFAVGTISAVQVLMLYGLIGLVWWQKRWHRYWAVALLLGIGLVAVPVGYAAAHLSQITVLATEKPVLVIQDKAKTGLIHGSTAKEAKFTVLPFLQKQGINQLDWAIAPNLQTAEIEGWQQILEVQPIRLFYSSPGANFVPKSTSKPAQSVSGKGSGLTTANLANANQTNANQTDINQRYSALRNQVQAHQGVALPLTNRLEFGTTKITPVLSKPDIWLLQINQQNWLWFDGVPAFERQLDLMQRLPSIDVIGWSGKALHLQLLEKLQPKVAIVYSNIDPKTEQWLQQHHIPIHWLDQDGALQWSSHKGFAKTGSEALP